MLTSWAAASGAVTVPLSGDAAIVQITQSDNQISAQGGNQLDPDLTGDGPADMTISSANFSSGPTNSYAVLAGPSFFFYGGRYFNGTDTLYVAIATSPDTANVTTQTVGIANTAYFPVTFSDPRINGGAPTNGRVEGVALGFPPNFPGPRVQLRRLFFNDADPEEDFSGVLLPDVYPEFIPEPSGPALLALGVAGVLARRKRRKAGTSGNGA